MAESLSSSPTAITFRNRPTSLRNRSNKQGLMNHSGARHLCCQVLRQTWERGSLRRGPRVLSEPVARRCRRTHLPSKDIVNPDLGLYHYLKLAPAAIVRANMRILCGLARARNVHRLEALPPCQERPHRCGPQKLRNPAALHHRGRCVAQCYDTACLVAAARCSSLRPGGQVEQQQRQHFSPWLAQPTSPASCASRATWCMATW